MSARRPMWEDWDLRAKDAEDERCEQEAEEWAHECSILESLDLDDTERAELANDELLESLEVGDWEPAPAAKPAPTPAPKPAPAPAPKPASRWQPAVIARLAVVAPGVELGELSDARELAGRPRLSASTDNERYFAPLWCLGRVGRGWLAQARRERAELTVKVSHPQLAHHAASARHELGLRTANPATWRLGELRAVAARALEILRDLDEAATPLRLVRRAS